MVVGKKTSTHAHANAHTHTHKHIFTNTFLTFDYNNNI